MSRIQDVTRALRDAKRAYERIMKRKRYTHFYTNEVYTPGHSEAQGAEPGNILAACDNLAYMEYLLKEKDTKKL